MDEQRIREIVREELAKEREAAAATTASKTLEIRTIPLGDPNDIPMFKYQVDQIIRHLELHRQAIENLYASAALSDQLLEQPSKEN